MVAPSHTRSRAVLIVDDDADIRDTLVEVVGDEGLPVFTAVDGTEALSLLDGPIIPRPCLILLDWSMAPMGGEAFVAQLRGRADFDQLSILIVSGTSIAPDAVHPKVLGTLQKPFELERLLAVLHARC
jgi:two-component system response regulator MprA